MLAGLTDWEFENLCGPGIVKLMLYGEYTKDFSLTTKEGSLTFAAFQPRKFNTYKRLFRKETQITFFEAFKWEYEKRVKRNEQADHFEHMNMREQNLCPTPTGRQTDSRRTGGLKLSPCTPHGVRLTLDPSSVPDASMFVNSGNHDVRSTSVSPPVPMILQDTTTGESLYFFDARDDLDPHWCLHPFEEDLRNNFEKGTSGHLAHEVTLDSGEIDILQLDDIKLRGDRHPLFDCTQGRIMLDLFDCTQGRIMSDAPLDHMQGRISTLYNASSGLFEKTNDLKDQAILVPLVPITWMGKWVDQMTRMTKFLAFLMRRQVKFKTWHLRWKTSL